jgi:hypothetical protein
VAIFRFEKTMTDPPREYELVYERYVRGLEDVESVHADSKKRERVQPHFSAWEWDRIDPELAGKLRSEELRGWAKRKQIGWMSPLEMLAPGYVPVEREERPLKTTAVKVAGWIGQERLTSSRTRF